ncbi:MAG: hypothetical protein DWQ01_00115 [Planctomycetota bacterium]|nr:MAG: hypothetical protein DWQ01_00115 [Planctomycetota bacterium]
MLLPTSPSSSLPTLARFAATALFLASPILGAPQSTGAAQISNSDSPLPLAQTERRTEPTRILLKAAAWDTRLGVNGSGLPEIPEAMALTQAEAEAAGYYYVQGGPDDQARLRGLVEDLGGRSFAYIPHNAFEARIPAGSEGRLREVAQALVPIHPFFKLDPDLGRYGTAGADDLGRHTAIVEFWPDLDPIQQEQAMRALDIEILDPSSDGRYLQFEVLADTQQLLAAAHLPAVRWIEESPPAAPRNDKSRWVIQTNQNNNFKIWQQGIIGNNVTIGHMDGRIQESSCYFDDPTGVNPGPSHRKIKWWSSSGGGDSHGTHTAGSAAGNSVPVNGSIFRIGMAPTAFLVHHSYFPSANQMESALLEANSHGARIHTNSWGNDWTTGYDALCRGIDAYSHDQEDAVVLFAITNGGSLKNPENAKSALSVGATDRSNQDRHGSGGAGPTADGRLKPEVYAPGCSTYSASTASCGTRTMCGTSMACPVVAGACALVKQYFEDGFYPSGAANAGDAFTPSGSLMRAMMANSAVDMTAESGYPSYREGWGRILLDNSMYFSGDGRGLWVQDLRHASGLSHGQTHSYPLNLSSGSNLRITLAFADEPGATGAAAPVVNNLNLRVVAPDGTVYHGNLLSTSGGESNVNPTKFDPRNTLETVNVANPMAGNWTVEVIGADIPVGPQGYALVAAY